MELMLTLVDPTRHREPADLIVRAEQDMSVALLAEELARVVGGPAAPPGGPALFIDGVPVPGDLPLGLSPVRDGAVVSLAGPTGARPPGQGLVEIRVVGGPGAGEVHRLGPSVTVVGSGPDAWIRLADAAVPQEAARITVTPGGEVTVRALGATRVLLEGVPVDGAGAAAAGKAGSSGAGAGETPWPVGSVLSVGRSLLERCAPAFPDAALRPSEDGAGLTFSRPPRILPPSRTTLFRLPTEPKPSDTRPYPWAMALLPLVGAVTLAVLRDAMIFLVMAAFTPLILFGSHASDRKHGRTSYRRARAEFKRQKTSIECQARKAMAEETAALRAGSPDPAALRLAATFPSHRLWERRPYDHDHGLLRVGTGALPSEVEIHDPNTQEHRRSQHRQLVDVPITVALRDHGVLGIAGHGESPRGIARWLVGQAAVLHSPDDLGIWVLTDASARRCWEWVRWLPHARARDGEAAVARLATDAETVARRIDEILALVTARRGAVRDARDPAAHGAWSGPSLVVVLDGSRRLRALPGVTRILREGPPVGVYAICLDPDRRLLPEECRAVVEEDHEGRLRVTRAGHPPTEDVRPDNVTPEWCEEVARALCPIREAAETEAAALPDACRLLDVLGLEPPTADAIRDRWAGGAPPSLSAVLGPALDGLFVVDLVRDGPHGLVAGTTGAGKSELLQTLVASLAAAHRPDSVNFVLVDYKGGAAFQDCVRLPHTVGMVTDLDAHLVRRALVSLGAELRRREHMLAAAGTKDLTDYLTARRRDASLAPLPRLLIVIDEFASLARELPDFVSGLVDIAQRGRSLGIHLILATQRPGGVVSPEIRANTNLRISLRVTDATESQDVIDAPDAARIAKSVPGRAFARLGASSLLPFQTARVGGRRPGATDPSGATPWAVRLPWEALGRTPPTRPVAARRDDDLPTDLAVLVDAIRAAATALGFPPPHRPWLPALGESVTLDELPVPASLQDSDVSPIAYGVTDVPARQSRTPLTLDVTDGRHLLLVGGPRSGRSTALRTIAGAVGAATGPADVHLYGMDCASGALLPLIRLPHCGCVVTRDQVDRVRRLLARLGAEVTRRQQLLASDGMTSAAEQRMAAHTPNERLPWMVLLVDGWEGFVSAFESYDYGVLVDQMKRLLQDGPSVGLKVVMTADRTGLSGTVSGAFADRLVLRLNDPADYVTAGISTREIPAATPPGRALRVTDDGVRESQVALLTADASGQAENREMHRIGDDATAAYGPPRGDLRPMRVDALPGRISASEALALVPGFVPPSTAWAMLGVGGDELVPLGVDLSSSGPGFVIAGPPRSGRSTALLTAGRTLLRGGMPVALILPRRSPLSELEAEPGVLGVLAADAQAADLRRLTDEAANGRFTVLVDDAELLYDTPLDAALDDVLRGGRDGRQTVLAAGAADVMASQYRGFLLTARRSLNGMLLSPQGGSEGDLFKVRLPRNAGGGPVGRGLLIRDGTAVPIQVATAAE